MTMPSIGNVASAGSTTATVNVSITVQPGTPALVAVAAVMNDAAIDVTSVVFDPGGADESAFIHEVAGDSNYTGAKHARGEVWILANPPEGGPYTVRFTANATPRALAGIVFEALDGNPSDIIGATATNSGTNAAPTVDVTTTAADSLVIGVVTIAEATPTATPGTDDSEVWDLQFNAGGSSRDDMAAWGASTPAATVGTYTVSGTLSATPSAWLAVGFELLAADDGDSEVTGSLSATLDDATIDAAGAVAVAGTVVATLDAATVVASGGVEIAGELGVTLDSLAVEATGDVAIAGELVVTLGDAVVSSIGVIGDAPISGALATTLDALTIVGAGDVVVAGVADTTLEELALSAAGDTPITGTISRTLDSLVLVSVGGVKISGALNAQLETLVLQAVGGKGLVAVVGVSGAVAGVSRSGIVSGPRRLGSIRSIQPTATVVSER